ncbi:hypothetical protein OsJ_10417 [Oryza sativa Japonica Group]|uniref:Uncharacterized protein n=1 Tax=Oryza sativa subsp. japonica TaxID=39947 RepID=B9F7Q5_ORYSJ|nr:hypothetical protein OsJ_10417 [Oryza sativa Japonica Group]
MDSGGDKEDGKEEDGSNVHGKGKGEDISNLKDGSIMDNGGQNSGSIFRERGFFYSIYPGIEQQQPNNRGVLFGQFYCNANNVVLHEDGSREQENNSNWSHV